MAGRLLTKEEFLECSEPPMRDVIDATGPAIDIWPYVDALDLDALGLPGLNEVHYVYRDARDRFDQILIGTGRFNTLLVIIVDRTLSLVYGHHLLDLNAEYGLSGDHLRSVEP
jgi:hypothetical protein